MAGQDYEKVAPADGDTRSDASGSDISSEHSASRSSNTRRRLRTSADVRRHDRETLTAEEEAERLLAGDEGGASALSSIFKSEGKQPWYKSRTARVDDVEKEEEVLHDVEQGDRSHSIGSSRNSSEADLQKLGEVQSQRRWRILRWTRFLCLHVFILLAFVVLLFGAFKASQSRPPESVDLVRMISNGTSLFLPTTIIISLDGFRADFLQRNITPTLNAFIKDGVSPKYMLPSFPSVTFANHFTLATGNYPESHGIVGNTFWDPDRGQEFYYTDPARSLQPEWWNAEPFWVTAEYQDVRTAIHMWPGSEAHLGSIDPAYVDEFNGGEHLDHKVDRILGWLDLPGVEDEGYNVNEPRPQLIAAYVPDVDTDGHNFGPNSTEITATITRADNMLADIFRGIDARNLSDIVNVIVVSDHGMATTDVSRLIQLEDLLDTSLIEHTDGWPLYGLRPYDTSDEMLQKLYTQLLEKSKQDQYKHSFDIYLRDSNMPERYHFSKNNRIAPLWIVPKAGWAIVTQDEFNVEDGIKNNKVYHPRGLHGYDFEHPLMRAIFVARGPAFPHPKGSQVQPFQNIEVYNIICDSLGIEPMPNNGTIRLPFKTSGVHDDKMSDSMPDDPPIVGNTISHDVLSITSLPATPTAAPSIIWTTDSHGSLVSVLADANGNPIEEHRPWAPDHGDDYDENLNHDTSWWEWFKGSLTTSSNGEAAYFMAAAAATTLTTLDGL
ncbi:hypothetical protein AMS68_002409 [Peltaster fructicola]|uniref:Phosphodiest-domain-containing protein n=1 Tax=Peltaster fructicola TaxID=286661 RepID=A0A6H0XQ49_9PEZI|nr:hypothetical protein AMS68_002409 [Peltaster fructicola]